MARFTLCALMPAPYPVEPPPQLPLFAVEDARVSTVVTLRAVGLRSRKATINIDVGADRKGAPTLYNSGSHPDLIA